MDEEQFLQAILDDPDEDVPRQVFADWLESRGDFRGELLRVSNLLRRVEVPHRAALEGRQQQLLHQEGVSPVAPTITNSLEMSLVWIPSGGFLMGSPPDEELRFREEQQHLVHISRGYWMSIDPVTQQAYQKMTGENPSEFTGGHEEGDPQRFPVERVSWYDATAFCNQLSEQEGLNPYYRISNSQREGISIHGATVTSQGGDGYRLPSEAEWEYACRAGMTTPFHFGNLLNGQQANCNGNYPYGTQEPGPYRQGPSEAGCYRPNAWGLYDMHGNIWEWCQDGFRQDYQLLPQVNPVSSAPETNRVYRGGGWGSSARNCRAANRDWSSPSYRNRYLGFRVVRSRLETLSPSSSS